MQQKQIRDVLRLLTPQKALDHKKIRCGDNRDGGYVMLNDFNDIFVALSFGIGGNDSWDLNMAERGIPVWQFDHTIETPPSTHSLLHFYRKKVNATLFNTVTHSNNLILKVDIDGDEWEMFDGATPETLKRYTQIVGEFHNLVSLDDETFFRRANQVFHKLYEQFAVVHIHGNNYGNIVKVQNIAIPETLEITFANRNRYMFAPNTDTFPTDLDYPNNPAGPDIWLGTFQF